MRHFPEFEDKMPYQRFEKAVLDRVDANREGDMEKAPFIHLIHALKPGYVSEFLRSHPNKALRTSPTSSGYLWGDHPDGGIYRGLTREELTRVLQEYASAGPIELRLWEDPGIVHRPVVRFADR